MMIKIDQESLGTLCVCAIRYCQGRMTYMPRLVREIVTKYLTELSDRDISVMLQDCDFQRDMKLWGDERIDKPGWIKWKEILKEEELRRKG